MWYNLTNENDPFQEHQKNMINPKEKYRKMTTKVLTKSKYLIRNHYNLLYNNDHTLRITMTQNQCF